MSVGAAFIFMLLAVGAVYGVATFTVSPPNPVANQPITLTWDWPGVNVDAGNPIGVIVHIYVDTTPPVGGCSGEFDSMLAPIATPTIQSNGNGVFTVTLAGLPAGTYDAVTEFPLYMAWTCNMFTVSPA